VAAFGSRNQEARVNSRSNAARTLPDRTSNGAEPDSPLANDDVPTAGPEHSGKPLTVVIVVPSLDAGAAAAGSVGLASILRRSGHRPIVVSRGGRMEADIVAAGAEFVRIDVWSWNPVIVLINAAALVKLIRRVDADVVHAHGRSAAWSSYLAARATRVPFLTTWHKGFREQNVLKRIYNGVMARGERVIAVSDQIADLISERHGVPSDRISVVPAGVDIARFDPAVVTEDRVEAVRRAWGIRRDARLILVVGRMVRRKGHHVVIKAVRRLKDLGLKDFVCVFAGEDQAQHRYSGEVWDLVLSTDTTDVIRLAGPADDLPAVYAAATVVVSGALQPEGLQRAILEAQAMGRPVVVTDRGASPEVVLAPPTVSEDRMTGLRVPAGDEAALAGALVRLFAASDADRRAIGARGRAWVAAQFNPTAASEQILALYAAVAVGGRHRRRRAAR
jgi:glycosyltransferase involved in cell wall biosynthesis